MLKKAILFFLILGGIQLFIYFTANKLPIPFDIFTTTSIILFFGIMMILTSVLLVGIHALTLLIPIYLQESHIYQNLFYTEIVSHNNMKLAKIVLSYLFLFFPSIVFGICIINKAENHLTLKNILYIELLWCFVFEAYIFTRNKKISRYLNEIGTAKKILVYISSYAFLLASKAIWIISILICIFIFEKSFQIKNEFYTTIFFLSLTIINCILFTPQKNKTHFQKNAEKYYNKNPFIEALKAIHEPSLLIVLIACIFLIWVWPNSLTTVTTLKYLGIGAVERQYHFSYKDKEDMPSDIIQICEPGSSCTTTKLKVVFDIGNLVIIEAKPRIFYYLPREKLKPIIDNNKQPKKPDSIETRNST